MMRELYTFRGSADKLLQRSPEFPASRECHLSIHKNLLPISTTFEPVIYGRNAISLLGVAEIIGGFVTAGIQISCKSTFKIDLVRSSENFQSSAIFRIFDTFSF